MSLPRLGFIGAGAVGRTLAHAFDRQGLTVEIAHARADARVRPDEPRPRTVPAADLASRVDIAFLTVTDDAIGEVCASLPWRPGQAVVHCSGATEIAVLAPAREAGASIGGFHPMQMFANPDVALDGLPGCLAGIEAEPPLQDTLADLARAIGMRPFPLRPGMRARYHASATYVGPFVLAVLREAAAIWESFGATETEAMAALAPLLKGTLAASADRGLAGGMGGCVARGDVGTVRRHLEALDALGADVGALYRALTRRTVPLAIARGTLTPDRAAAILAALDAPVTAEAGTPPPVSAS